MTPAQYRKERIARGSQSQVAALLGIDPQTIVYNHLNQPRELVDARFGEPVTGLFG